LFGVLSHKPVADWAFDHYLRIAPPEFAGPAPQWGPRARRREIAATLDSAPR
jgi:hypothetical protein